MFQHVKQYRQRYGLTQEALGELMGVNPKFIYCLERNRARVKNHDGQQVVFTPQEEDVLSFLFGTTPKTPDFFNILPTLTAQDFAKIRNGRKMATASWMIGISASQWSLVESGKSKEDQPHIRRWYTLLLMVHFPEYFANLTPAHETPMVDAQVCNVASVLPNVASEPVMLPANVASDDFVDQPGLIPFAYGSQKVRVKWIDGEPWFMLSDVCKAVGYGSPHKAYPLIRENDRKTFPIIDAMGRTQEAVFISERGMSQFFLRARVPAVEPFQDWVFDEVLPSIYKTGQYQVNQPQQIQAPADPLSQVLMIGQALQTIAEQMQVQASEISSLKEQVSKVNYLEVSKTDRSEVLEIVQSEVLESKLKEKQEQKIHYRKRKELEKHVSDLGWAVVKRHGGNHGEVIKSVNKRIKAALRGVYGYAIARERYTDDDFALAYQVVAMAQKEFDDFPKQGEIDFGGAA